MPHNTRFQTDRRRILIAVLIANLLLAAAVGVVLWVSWDRNRNGIEQILQSEAAFWADAINQRYDQLQATCTVAQRQLHDHPDLLQQPGPWLSEMNALMPFIDGVSLVAPTGDVLALAPSRAIPPQARAAISASPGFQETLSKPGRIRIGLAQPDPLAPEQRITPARCALTLHKGAPRPEVMLIFDVGLQRALQNLQHTLSSFNGKGRWVPAVGLLRSDGYLLARLPAPLPQIQPSLKNAPARGVLAREIAAHPEQTHGVFLGPVQAAGGAELLGAWQRLGAHSVVAFTSLPASALTALWWRQTWPMLTGWAMLLLMQLLGGLLINRSLERQHRLAQINAALAQASQVVAEAPDEATLFQRICDISADAGGMQLAWIGQPDVGGQAKVLAAAGKTAYLDGMPLSIHADQISGQGPFGKVWRDAAPLYVQGKDSAQLLVPWAGRMKQFGLRTMAALPVLRQNRLYAVFSIYRDSRARITRDQRNLLEELARSLGRGLDRLQLAEAERKERESRQRQQELVRGVMAQIDILISARNDAEVLESACTRLLETGLFAAVWVAQPDVHERVHPLAAGGNALDTLSAQSPPLLVSSTQTHALARAWHTSEEAQET
ncbi:MAG TPA: GAF domain-containing protein, partial [Thiomonas arsenitoxydans]|nr:GAF domain-containing protein [Thiomonas arsenitoxydans]